MQTEAEEERKRLAFSSNGLAANIITGGLGDTSVAKTLGVVLGGR